MSKLLQEFEASQITRELPAFGPGDTVVVNVKVKEGNRERVQAYEGVVIAKKNAGLNSAFTVRKISHGYGVERDSGVKNLNRFLPGETRQLLERALSMQNLSQATLVQERLARSQLLSTRPSSRAAMAKAKGTEKPT